MKNTDANFFILQVGIVDPPRKEIPGVVSTVRRAGCRVVMVTGDFSITATAIAKQCGIITANKVDNAAVVRNPSTVPTIRDEDDEETYYNNNVTALVISGSDLMEGFSDHEWDVICSYSEIVFARTTPEQKLRIVNGKLSMSSELKFFFLHCYLFSSLQSRNACSWCYCWCHW